MLHHTLAFSRWLLCATIFFAVLSFGGSAVITLQAPGDIVYTITEQGLTSITVDGQVLATGFWHAINAETYVGYGDGTVKVANVTEEKLTVLTANHVRVTHIQGEVTVNYDYELTGEDLTITAYVENNNHTADLQVIGMGGLQFPHAPNGNGNSWHNSYLIANRGELFHPAGNVKIGGSFVTYDEAHVGIGLTPVYANKRLLRTLFHYARNNWNPGGEKDPYTLWYLLREEVPRGGARTFGMIMRVSKDTNWQHLLERYREQYVSVHGNGVKYLTDYRWVAVAHINRDVESMTAENPYGFHGGRWIHTEEGMKAFANMIIPGLKKGDGQGLIIWGHSGQFRTGAMYRPDFDCMPPEVEKQWPLLRKLCDEAGMRFGVCARPAEIAYRTGRGWDGTLNIDGSNPQHLEMMWRRFQNMDSKGCSLYYLDSFGSSYNDYLIMRYLREKMGSKILTYCEHQSDAIIPYSGCYTEVDFWGNDEGKGGAWGPRTGEQAWEIFQWLCPGVTGIGRAYDIHGKMPANFESINHFLYRIGMTPQVEDYTVNGEADTVHALQNTYLAAPDRRKP